MYKDFVESFEDAPKASTQRTWIKGGVVQAGSGEEAGSRPAREPINVYKPSQKYGKPEEPLDEKKPPVQSAADMYAKPKLGRKEEKKKMSNLELFKEELRV